MVVDNKIIDALDCCRIENCNECPYREYFNCREVLTQDVFNLINRQKTELEDLREIVFTDRTEAIKNLKAEAIKEFAERLKSNIMRYGFSHKMTAKVHIDNLVKEMTE